MKRPEKNFIKNIILIEGRVIVQPLKETVHRYKNNPEEVAVMCAELEKWSLEERQEGESRLTTLNRPEKNFIRNTILVEIGIMAQPFTFGDAAGWLHAETPDFS